MKIKKVVIGVLITVYVLVAVALTACLLTFNDYKVSIFGDKSLIIVKNKEFEPNYKKGSLLIVTKNKNEDIKTNDEIFFYNAYKNIVSISYSKVIKTEKITDTQTTYTITGDYDVSSDYVIGKASTTKVINNVGSIMSVLESRWGFIFMIILPIAVAFIYEIYVVVKEIVRPEEELKEKPKEDEKPEEPKEEAASEEQVTEVKEETTPETHEEEHVEAKEETAEPVEETKEVAEETPAEEPKEESIEVKKENNEHEEVTIEETKEIE